MIYEMNAFCTRLIHQAADETTFPSAKSSTQAVFLPTTQY